MKKIRVNAMKFGIDKFIILILIFGVIIGTVFANFFREEFFYDLKTLTSINLSSMNKIDINYGVLLKYVLVKNFKPYLLIWILNITILGIPFMILFILYSGFFAGFMVSIFTINYGLKGILLFLAYLFPQYLIYIPVFIITLWRGYTLYNENLNYKNINNKGNNHSFWDKFIMFFMLALFLIIGSVVETYVNTYIVKNIIQMMS